MAVLILVRDRDRSGLTKSVVLEVKLILKAVLECIPRITPLQIGGEQSMTIIDTIPNGAIMTVHILKMSA
jgi:hypothetical protein